MYKLVVTMLVISFTFYGCSYFENNDDDKIVKEAAVDAPEGITKSMVELGPVSGGTVKIKTLDGYELASYMTNSQGYYDINITKLRTALSYFDNSINFVRIISYGGIDTDVDDDGTHKQKLIQGNVSGIVPISMLLENKEQRITFITTAIDKILGGSLNITEEQIIRVAKELGLDDNNLTIDKIINYKMSENESKAEEELREFFLSTIHDNNVTESDNIINELKYQYNMIIPTIRISSLNAFVKFEYIVDGNYIQYAIKDDQNVSFQKYYLGNEVSISKGEVMFFQECSLLTNCYKIQKVYFDGNQTFVDYLDKSSFTVFNASEIQEYKNSKIVLENNIKDMESNISALESLDISEMSKVL